MTAAGHQWSGYELAFLIASITAIVVIFVAEWLRANLRDGGKLPPPVLLFIRIFLGITFLFLGVIGAILPVLQGWIFFLLAALMFFPQSRFAVKACDKIEPKMPRLIGWLRRRGIGTHRGTEQPEQ
jgi:quinol-cytochrome oxidoreductase complex cytochrome b subunit